MNKRQARLRAIAMVRRRDRQAPKGNQGWWMMPLVAMVTLLLLTPVLFVTATTAAAAGSALVVYNMFEAEVRDGMGKINTIRDRDMFESTRIYDRNGVMLYEIVDQGRRTPVSLDEMPKTVIDATIATEDDTFWENPGFDPPSIARAFYQNFTGGRIMSGFSTITQQLVRHVAFDYEERVGQSYERKVKEVVLAWVMTQRMGKREILQTYLNEIYYGNLSYGIEAASKTFFGKAARDLNDAEATFLVGLPQSPLDMDPFTETGYKRARARQELVLSLMVRHGYITEADADRIFNQGVNLVPEDKRQVSLIAPHFVTYVRQQLEDRFGVDRVNRGGLQVTTTLDLRLQNMAESVARQQVAQLAPQHVTNAAVVALKNDTGEILSMVGSVNYWDSSIQGRVNVAVAERQPGSSIKPITYAAGLERGVTTADIIWDVKMKEKLANNEFYEPKNYDEKFHGPVRMRTALANSYNIPAVKMIKRVGVQETLDAAHRLGINGLNRGMSWYGLSLTLGGGEVTLLDLTTAYSSFARMGHLIPPASILKVVDNQERVLYQYTPPQPQLVMNPAVAYIITDILSDEPARIPAFGPNSPLKLTQPAAVKTGTTNDYKDNWTMGYTPYMTVGVWVGNADNTAMINSTGVTGAAPIWHDFFETVFKTPEVLEVLRPAPGAPLQQTFVRPPGVVEAEVCAIGPTCAKKERELFLAEAKPPKDDPAWQVVNVISFQADKTTRTCAARPGDRGTRPMTVLKLPPDPEEQKEVRTWLQQAKWPVATPAPCTDTWLRLAAAGIDPEDTAAVAKAQLEGLPTPAEPGQPTPTLRPGQPTPPPASQPGQASAPGAPPRPAQSGAASGISGPANDTTVNGVVPVVGAAQFNPAEIQFYKIEYRPIGGSWVTIGDTHAAPRSGLLETWHAEVLPPGVYQLRLVLVKHDGNFIVPSIVTVRKEG